MTNRQDWTGTEIPALGMGCWAIGGPFFAGEDALGWGETDDAVSQDAIRAALDAGIRLFDTAQAYGTGHSERLLGEVVGNREDVRIVTKVGIGIDPATRQVTGEAIAPAEILEGLEASRQRLRRDKIDLVLLHLNELSPDLAADVFDTLDTARENGWIGAYGWSTDFADSVRRSTPRKGFVAVEHAMNVFLPADDVLEPVEAARLVSLNRSPLAMGLLGGRITAETRIGTDDIRGRSREWMAYFKDGRPVPRLAGQLEVLRELLGTGGRSLAQGAIGWIWARSGRTFPVPGARTPAQVEDWAGALAHGPLPGDVMAEIERVIDRPVIEGAR